MRMDRSTLIRFVVGACMVLLIAGIAWAQEQMIEIKNGTILAVNGNVLTVRSADGVKDYNVPPGFQFDMNGQMLGVQDLKPGMPIAAKITTTEYPVQLTSTEVKQGKVLHSIGSAFVVKTQDGKTMRFSAKDIDKRGIVIYKDGKQISAWDLKAGDNISATVVTVEPPEMVTEQEVQAFVAMPPQPRPVYVAQVRKAPPPPPPPPAPRQLPKTGSDLPLVGILGLLALALGAGLTIRRLIAG